MKTYAILPKIGAIQVKVLADENKNPSYVVQGKVSAAVKQAAKPAVRAARDGLNKLSSIMAEYDEKDNRKEIIFKLDSDSVENGYVGGGLAAVYAMDKILRCIQDEAGQNVEIDYNIGVVGQIDFPEPGKPIPIESTGIDTKDLVSAIKIIGKNGKLFIPDKESISFDDLSSELEQKGITCERISTVLEIIQVLLKDCAQVGYRQTIVPICEEVDRVLNDYLELEHENEKFKDYYMQEVISTFERLRDLQHRREYYEKHLKEMLRAKAAKKPVKNICDEIREALKDTSPFAINLEVQFKITERCLTNLKKENVPEEILVKLGSIKDKEFTTKDKFVSTLEETLGEEKTKEYKALILRHAKVEEFDDIEDEDEIEDIASFGNILEDAFEAETTLTDLEGRFKRVVFYATHPDYGGSVEKFRIAKKAAEDLDQLLMEVLILKYWPLYIQNKQKEENTEPDDDMSRLESTIKFLREARSIKERFLERKKSRSEDSLTREQIEWNEGLKQGKDEVHEQKEALIVRCKEEEKIIKDKIGAIRKLCRQEKRAL